VSAAGASHGYALRESTQESVDDWSRAWAQSFGARWYLDVAVMAVVVFCFGLVRPLSDPDLPMHLAVGEWIVRNGAVPFVEPFAWTRAGAPYYAYSWLQQVTYYELLHLLGPWGLRAFQGLLVLSSAIAMVVLARAAHWRPGQAVMLAALNLIVGSFFVGFLRPQSILLITIPLIWAGAYHLTRGRGVLPAAVVMFLASAATANSHLFFPLTLAPLALLWVHPPPHAREWVIGVLSVVLGWFASPYAMHWPEVFAHNFGANVLTRPPSVVTELQPGFVSMLYPKPTAMLGVVALMLAIPWALRRVDLRPRELWLTAVYWIGGVVLFGYASRLFVVWWLLSLPAIGLAIVHLTRDSEEGPPRLRFRLLGLLSCALIIATQLLKTRDQRAMEGDTERRTLPTFAAAPAERLAAALERAGAADRDGRMMSSFAYGSYLTWRLPRLSQSIDSRGVFPDSVAAAEAVVLASDRDVPLGPWRSADLALVPVRYRVAAVLDTAAGWRRMATAPGAPVTLDSVGLWARRDWWAGHGGSIPAQSR
jgi:hypothetical protein